jgi:predicted nucleic-acid-binding protein
VRSAEDSDIMQHILIVTNFIFSLFDEAKLQTFFESTKQKSIYFINSIEIVEYVKFLHLN